MSGKRLFQSSGPFRADQLRCGDPYELSDGHPVVRLTGTRRVEVYELNAPHYMAYPGSRAGDRPGAGQR